jgi:tetratricopeptide (TPR) repeat protein
MNDDSRPENDFHGASPAAGDGLSEMLEELVQRRATQDGALPAGAVSVVSPVEGETASSPSRCPEPGDWVLLLDKDPHPKDFEKAGVLLAHAAGCKACAQRLRMLSANESLEESATLAGLSSATAERQRKLAAELARTPREGKSGNAGRLYLWTGAGLAASLLIGAGLLSWWKMVNTPERLLADAYSSARIFDLRMPGAGFAEVKAPMHLRGGPQAKEPAKLTEARERIDMNLAAAPEDPHWLELEARSDVMEEKFDTAIEILDHQVSAGPVTSSLLLDDAVAYFQRGTATGSDSDRAMALDLMRRADEMAPSDTVVLFNEAVAMEDRGQLMNAVETWNRYLRFERDARWLAEGRRRLAALEQKLNELKTRTS